MNPRTSRVSNDSRRTNVAFYIQRLPVSVHHAFSSARTHTHTEQSIHTVVGRYRFVKSFKTHVRPASKHRSSITCVARSRNRKTTFKKRGEILRSFSENVGFQIFFYFLGWNFTENFAENTFTAE